MKIAMLLSGGVDSSVALGKLVNEGKHDITAFYLKIWLEDDLAFLGECPWEEDLTYARAVCEKYNVTLKIVSLQSAYWSKVVSHTIKELKTGRTPSPDILCNQRVKFGAFTDYIDDSYDKIATGHYATTVETPEGTRLKMAVDPVKDQTYFLTNLSQQQLDRCLFPLGGLPKAEVRQLAKKWNLPNKERGDSQGICFLGKIKYNEFVKCHLGEKPGAIIEKSTGKKLGNHKGYWFHTVGQRRGLGLSGGPWFVVGKDIEKNEIHVANSEDSTSRETTSFQISSPNWLGPEPAQGRYRVKVRHGARTTTCSLSPTPEVPYGNKFTIDLDKPDGGIAAGQYAIVYDGDICRGGGVIC